MNEATRKQIEAAHPGRSTWLSANAGSGKTRVLTDRVARLLLGGVSPQNILCLTYTKAAASEMQNRLFKTLGKWAMLPEDDLRVALEDLSGGEHVIPEKLAEARRLFAKAVETPGGLRIQTIHSFCAILLRKFPVEADVSPQFTEMDDRSADVLRADCLETLAERDPDNLLAMAEVLNGGDMLPFLAALTSERDAFAVPLDEVDLRRMLDLPADLELADLISDTLDTSDLLMLHRVADAMTAHGGPRDINQVAKLRQVEKNPEGIAILVGCLLTGAAAKEPFAAKVGKFPSAASRNRLAADDTAALDDLMLRVEAARAPLLALTSLHRNLVLQRFAAAYLPIYAMAKRNRSWLDFDDLILKARDLLTDSPSAQWVLYRLDGAIDHILVDEAQDTSPAQWQMIRALSQEVASGEGTRETGARTVFVVGDKKQSIYSFQGADPEGFDQMYDRFETQLGEDAISRLEMLYSFRSSSAILKAVDATFSEDGMRHIAFHDALPGRVDLWPLIEPSDKDSARDFDDPVDIVAPEDAMQQLAQKVADRISTMIATESIPNTEEPDTPGEFRRIHAGDVLILFRSRGSLFHATIRACKAAGIPMAGADRLTLSDELAVKDLWALLSFLATPEDSLSLAAALKSPLFGWDEQALFDLSAKRSERHLWEALRARSSEFPETMRVLDDLRSQAGFLRPYELIERILTRHRGRARLVGRLGKECVEAIDGLLSQAMIYERTDIPSLTGFLSWLEAGDVEIKRQSESRGTNLRIMTIHGAKGLESPIVIMPDTMLKPHADTPRFWPVDDARMLGETKESLPDSLRGTRAEIVAKQDAERDRLLYVAMTRAQFWLIVAGAGNQDDAEKRWYGQVRAGMMRLSETAEISGVRRFEVGDWVTPNTPQSATRDAEIVTHVLPDWVSAEATQPIESSEILSPSDLGGLKVLAGESGSSDLDIALSRGTELHLLLEHLPPDRPDDWYDLARRTLPDTSDEELIARLRDVEAVLRHADLRFIFDVEALTEVALTAPLPGGKALAGTIDRLIVEPKRVLAIDFKSNRVVPTSASEVPNGLLRQMGAYDHALSLIYPDRQIETALLWIETPELMPLPRSLVRNAFGQVVDLDAPGSPA